jgi:hypothetical protein
MAVDDQRLEVVVAGAGGRAGGLEPVPPHGGVVLHRLHQFGGEAFALLRVGRQPRTDLLEEAAGRRRFLQRFSGFDTHDRAGPDPDAVEAEPPELLPAVGHPVAGDTAGGDRAFVDQ